MSTSVKKPKSLPLNGHIGVKNKLAFACGDIFGGGSFNIINFLFTPFLTLVVGLKMVYLTPILLFTKIWDGIIDPFIGKITDAKKPGRFGKRRFFMLISAPLVLIGFVLLFFPWNLVTDNDILKCVLVVFVYMMYATAQSFVLIPYYSHASEMTDDFTARNNTNAVRLAFSIMSSLICVAVPGLIASPTKGDNGVSYIIMASVFGVIFTISILITALFSREQVITGPIKRKFNLKEFFRPLKMATYRKYLGMQMCASFGMAVMSSFFFTLCDFYLRSETYRTATLLGQSASRFPIATVAAAVMFFAQIIALPIYLKLIKVKSKRFAYIIGAIVWIVVAAAMLLLPGEATTPTVVEGINKKGEVIYNVITVSGAHEAIIIMFGLLLGLGIGGTVFVPHSAFGDVCDVGELYFGERTEGSFSGLTNFLNTTAQAIGLAIPPLIIGLTGYIETQYVTLEKFAQLQQMDVSQQIKELGMALENFKSSTGNGNVQLLPLSQPEKAKISILVTFSVLPIVIMAFAIWIASRYKLTKQLQAQIVELNGSVDKSNENFAIQRRSLLQQVGENVNKIPETVCTLAEQDEVVEADVSNTVQHN